MIQPGLIAAAAEIFPGQFTQLGTLQSKKDDSAAGIAEETDPGPENRAT